MRRSRQRAEDLAAKGQIDKAVRIYQELVAQEPDDAGARDALADLYEAQADLRRAQGKKSDAAAALERLAEIRVAQRRHRQAIRAYRRIAVMFPDRDDLADTIAALRRRQLGSVFRLLGLLVCWVAGVELAGPPSNLWPLALVCVIPLYLAIRDARIVRAIGIGWLFGFAVNLAGYRWGVQLLERFTGMSPAMAVVSLGAMCAYHALVWALWAGICSYLHRRVRLDWLIAAPLALVVCESVVPMIFPWYLAITAWRAWPLLQIAELGGPPAVSALLVLLNLLMYEAGVALRARILPRPLARWAAVAAAAILVIGTVRAWHIASVRTGAPALRVGIVQPNFGIMSIQQRERRGRVYMANLQRATAEAGRRGAQLVVWPESMFPFLFDRGLEREYAKGHPWELSPGYDGRLLFGALAHPFGESYIYNSAVLVSGDGAIRGIYDKTRLLVFAEYIPMAERFPVWATGMRKRLPDWPEIRPGSGPGRLVDGELRIAPLICYEDILPDYVHTSARRDTNLLVTLANHAWFGDNGAAYQAEALAVLRGVETRRDLVRATNTGVSSISDALGRVRIEGALHGVDPENPPPYEILVSDVALVDAFALAPYTARWFPWVCGLLLLALLWRRRHSKR